jgi:hypothetical protein
MVSGSCASSIKWTIATFALLAALSLACPAQASTIEIDFVAFPIHYGTVGGNQDFYDATSVAGGDTSLATATPMGIVTVSVDGVVENTYSANQVYGDLLVADVGSLNKLGTSYFSGDTGIAGLNNRFGFDLLTSSGSLLSMNFNNADISGQYKAYSSGANSGKPILFYLGGPVSSIASQNLLGGGQQIGDDASFSLSGTNFSNVTTSTSAVTGFTVNVTGSITGTLTLVPEPSSIVLLSMSTLAMAGYAMFRRRNFGGARGAV